MSRSRHIRATNLRSRGQPGKVRIIAGRWRGRRLSIPDLPELRPTGDRIRETLFNWLSGVIVDATCLDLFAGSGVLGFECASRGASEVVLVDRSREVIECLERHAGELGDDAVRIVCADAMDWLSEAGALAFDVIFLDPPFGYGVVDEVCARLEETGRVRPGGYIYIEQDHDRPAPSLPSSWTISREKKAGRVRYYLARRV